MKKSIYIIVLTMLFAFCANGIAQERIWVKPSANYLSVYYVTIERVEFTDTATTLFFHCDFIPHYWINVSSNSFLRLDGKEYPIRSAKGLELDKRLYMPDSGEADFSLSFSPLPDGDKPFDFVESVKGVWVISYIREQNYIPENLTDTYWRDMKKGEWLIGFADGKIVYDSKVWRSVLTDAKKDAYKFTIERDGENSHTVTVDNVKNGMSRIAVDGQKAVECNIIKTNVLDDYPEPDETSQWNKANITRMDTACICGWIKGSELEKPYNNRMISIFFHEIFLFNQKKMLAPLDSLGYFEIKVPMMEATEIVFGYGKFSFSLALEPGKHYFLLCDFKTGHQLMMGEDARVQNEMLAHGWFNTSNIKYFGNTKEKLTEEGYLDYVFSEYNKNKNKLEQGFKKHPNLSVRYKELLRNNLRLQNVGASLWQSGIFTDLYSCKRYQQFMQDSLKARLPRPMTLYPYALDIVSDYVNQLGYRNGDTLSVENSLEKTCSYIPDEDYRSFYAARRFLQNFEHFQKSLSPELKEFVRKNITNPVAREKVLAENNVYIELEKGNHETIQKYLKTIDFGSDVKGGKQMLDEILKPLRGKIVLVTIWGTWYRTWEHDPIEHSQELYKGLADYDIAYVYLSNRSNELAWKNKIQRYNVVGDNVYHYNLPKEQQAEIESALGIDAPPKYFLFDRNGNMVEKDFKTEDVRKLKSMLDKHGGKRR